MTKLTAVREKGDPKFYGELEAKGESNLLHYIKTELNKQGYDLIKKRMAKDGHMVSDIQQYLRTRSSKSKGPHIMIYNAYWQIASANDDWNKLGTVELAVVNNCFEG